MCTVYEFKKKSLNVVTKSIAVAFWGVFFLFVQYKIWYLWVQHSKG